MTISGIAIAAISSGQRLLKFHAGSRLTAKIKTMGNAIDAAIEASDTYRHAIRTTAHTAKATAAQIVKYGQRPNATPRLVATPLPPLNLRYTGNM